MPKALGSIPSTEKKKPIKIFALLYWTIIVCKIKYIEVIGLEL
jgi:hypothetical protein